MDFSEEDLENEELNDNGNASGTIPESPEPSDNELLNDNAEEEGNPELGKYPVENDIEDAKGSGKKKDVKKLMQRYIIAVSLSVVGLAIFVTILIFVFDIDLVGIGNTKPKYYAPPSCGKVFLTWEDPKYTEARKKVEKDYEPITDASLVDLEEEDQYGKRYIYKPYEYDTYVAGVIWTDNYNAKDIDNEVVYEAMAIVARSRLISELPPNNCVVLKNYNEQAKSFRELTGSEEKYSEIVKAVEASQGMMIGRNNKILSAKYDDFSYVERRQEESVSESSFFYRMMQKNNEEQQMIHASWVEKLEKEKGVGIPKKHVFKSEKFSSMSLYGAKYLLEKEDSQYELFRILKYYFGQDIEFYTISYYFSQDYEDFDSDFSSECSDISMTKTMLSREEFIALAQSYGSGKSGGAKLLADNAGMIYDLCVANNFNPELIFIRAKIEGFDPGGSTYNFWGIGCTNTGGVKACYTYNSLSEGVLAFIKYASKYSTVFDMMSRWAYLGKYWYNPGKSSIGGCYYAEYIYDVIPDRVKAACDPSRHCDISGGPDCVETTEEDQAAYDRFQVKRMLQERQTIFKLGADTCEQKAPMGEPGVGSCTPWRQGDSRWGNIYLGTSSTNMSRSGCLVTSVAIAISCSGTQINNVATFNPGTLVQKMNAMGGFSGANMYWSNEAIRYFAPNFRFVNTLDVSGLPDVKVQMVSNQIMSNTSILLHFVNEKHPRGHWVVLKSISGTNFTVYDPATGGVNTYSASDLDRMGIYRY